MRIVGRTASHLDPVVALLWRTHGLGADGSWADDPYAWLSPDGTVGAWVALDDDGRVLGHVALVVAGPGRMPELTRLLVDPADSGADVADLLLDVVERSVPGPHIRLDVAEDAHTTWEHYERRGWRLTGRGPAEWCGPDDAVLTMRSYAKRVG